MRRLISAVLVAGALTFVGLGPAHAVPAAPVISGLDTSTAGHERGTVTSDQPYVFVRMTNDTHVTMVTVSAGTGSFDLETWGYGSGSGTTTVEAVACPTATVDGSCSALATSAAFTPSDVTPAVTWFADDTIGPGQADPSITVSDTGGGDLRAIFVSDVHRSDVLLDHNGTTVLPTTDGVGYVRITRCRTGSTFVCNDLGFSAPVQHPLEVRRTATATWTGGDAATAAHPTPSFDVSTSRATGTDYSLAWQLEAAEPSTPTTSASGTASGTLTGGTATGITIDTTNVADGSYVVFGTVTITDPDFGTYTDVPILDGFLVVDKTGPQVTAATAHPATIFPRVGTATYPATTTVDVTGTLEYADTAAVRNASGTTVAQPQLDFANTSRASLTWTGRTDGGTVVPSGSYTVVVLDQWGNVATTVAHVSVDARSLITKTLVKTVTAKDSKVLQRAGACSSVRSPSTHGWTGSISLLSNNRCRRTSSASTVVTGHLLKLPAAAAYGAIRLSLYGGAARKAAGSRAQLSFLTVGGRITPPKIVGATVGTHAGTRAAGRTVVISDSTGHYLVWYVATGGGNRYDVKNFTVRLTYQVWS